MFTFSPPIHSLMHYHHLDSPSKNFTKIIISKRHCQLPNCPSEWYPLSYHPNQVSIVLNDTVNQIHQLHPSSPTPHLIVPHSVFPITVTGNTVHSVTQTTSLKVVFSFFPTTQQIQYLHYSNPYYCYLSSGLTISQLDYSTSLLTCFLESSLAHIHSTFYTPYK